MSRSQPNRNGRMLIGFLAIALFLVHQDFWFWDSKTLVFGFLPIGLFYHAMFSLAAGLLWALAVKLAWPTEIEAWADAAEQDSATEGGQE